MSKVDEFKGLEEEFHAWKLAQQLREAEKAGQWKTCTLAWSLITLAVGTVATLCAKFSKPVLIGLKAFWAAALEQIQ